MRNPFARLGLATLICVLAWLPAAAGKNLSKLQETVDAMSETLVKATLAGDVDTAMSYYADDCVSMPNYGGILKGKKAIREYQENMTKMGIKILSMDFSTLDLWQDRLHVYETGTYELSLNMPGRDGPVADSGKYMTVYAKQRGGGLRIKREIWNTDMNPWAMTGSGHQAPEPAGEEYEQLREAKTKIAGIVEKLRKRAFIGLDGKWDESLNGYRVSGYLEGSSAREAGVLWGDVLVKVNGIPLSDREGSVADAPNRRPGREAVITVLRDGVEHTMTVTLMGVTDKVLAEEIGNFVLNNYFE